MKARRLLAALRRDAARTFPFFALAPDEKLLPRAERVLARWL